MVEVVVVGAGPTGLALACGLRAAEVPVRVLDGAPGPASTSRALGLQPRGVEVLDRLGALGDLPAHGLPIRRVAVSVGGRTLAHLEVGRPTRYGGPAALLLGQAEVEQALRERLAALGGTVEWGVRVAGLAADPDGVTLSTAGGGSVRAGWVVGCDGAHSVVRKAAGIGFPGVPLVERFLLADVRADVALPRDAVAVFLHGTDMLAAFPLPGADLWRLMTPAEPGVEPTAQAVVARMRDRLRAEAGGEIRSVEWTTSFRIHRRLARTYRSERVLLAGDAAHIHSPLGGQGMNTGLGDAENLAWKLALVVAGRAGDPLLDSYQAERRPVAREVLAGTSGATNLVFGGSAAARVVRDRFVVPLLARPGVQRRIAERSSQLGVTYRRGPLGGRGRDPRPGDRLPDRALRRADGTATRLYAETGPGWALVGGTAALHAAARARLGAVAALTAGDPPAQPALLVRPDGHLGWRGTDPHRLTAWLDRALGDAARSAPGILAG